MRRAGSVSGEPSLSLLPCSVLPADAKDSDRFWPYDMMLVNVGQRRATLLNVAQWHVNVAQRHINVTATSR